MEESHKHSYTLLSLVSHLLVFLLLPDKVSPLAFPKVVRSFQYQRCTLALGAVLVLVPDKSLVGGNDLAKWGRGGSWMAILPEGGRMGRRIVGVR